MAEERVQRKLTTILAADVEGYSRLMRADEEATLKTLGDYREIIDGLIARHDGRIFSTGGDSVLAEFGSAVEAVRCAVSIQEETANRNAELADDRKLMFRIGINVGDVMVKDGDLFGDGVNVAARLEGLAEAGGVCVSGSVFEQVRHKLSLGFEDMGAQQVKNIAEPVSAFRVVGGPVSVTGATATPAAAGRWRMPTIAAAVAVILAAGGLVWWQPWTPDVERASVARMAFPLPEKPSIAVLPFDNMSGDPNQDYFSNGLTDSLITALSQASNLFVIARNSTFTYKDKPTKVQSIAEELGVRYVLEGSVQRSGERVRINAQLIDALTGRHLWAEEYDRDATDIFALQDDIKEKVFLALSVKLTEGEQTRIWRRETKSFEAYRHYLQAKQLLLKPSRSGLIRARQLYQKALDLDPEFTEAWEEIGWSHFIAVLTGWTKTPAADLARAEALARKAMAMDAEHPGAHNLLGDILVTKGRHDEGVALCEKAVALAPNKSEANAVCARINVYAGNAKRALALTRTAMRLSPYYPSYYLLSLGAAHRMLGDLENAIAAFEAATKRAPRASWPNIELAATYAMADRDEEARAAGAEVLKRLPRFTVSGFAKRLRYRDGAHRRRILDALRKAGLPERPPLPLPTKPSIAVLPFTNMSDDRQQEYFADGITEDIITDLSNVSGLFVIARNSSFKYKGKSVDVRDVARDLGIRYVLEGSVRRVRNQVRINAQLVDTRTGGHLWAERFDRDYKDIFALQDEVIGRIVSALAVRLTDAEKAQQATRRRDVNLQAYDNLLRGRQLLSRIAGQDTGKAKEYFEKAISIDPGYARAYTNLGLLFWNEWRLWGRDRDANLARAFEFANKAIQLDPADAGARTLLAVVHQFRKEHALGEIQADKAIALGPTHVETLGYLGDYLRFAGHPRKAIEYLERAMRLDPYHPTVFLTWLGGSYSWIGQYDQAIKILNRAISREPDYIVTHLILAAAYAQSGKDADARAEAAEVLRLNPNFTLHAFAAFVPIRMKADLDRFVMALRKAGIPE